MFTFNLDNSGADRCSMALPVQNKLQNLLICSDLLNQLLFVYIDLISYTYHYQYYYYSVDSPLLSVLLLVVSRSSCWWR